MTTLDSTLPPARIVIPWRPAPSRIDAFERVVAWYRETLPQIPLQTVDTGDTPFVLAACRNAAMRNAAADEVVVVGDADTIPEREPLIAAIRAAADSPFVHLPYDEYRWLGRTGSADHAAGVPLADCTVEQHVEGACSGVYVATPRAWDSHGGQDEGFRGWGFEDAAWFLAHSTILGAPPVRHPGRVYALHHVGEVRAGAAYDANAARMESYRAAAGDPAAMAALVGAVRLPDAVV
ncbi:hypothetical protein [Microbacterium sp. nov. GSS16]|uniref:hypothetical protein n=1 Tax=Microbacterium sp. nov. GSS16 TaxID=3019890 RepID=UPI002304F4D6|nr:hypothetical protein [Microbacterium sp. nov. GSS16]MEE2815281.1 hypothetical protein [Actinomycetota bacterium]WCD92060.1 hypothetical protein PGB26_10300 [Microbacterium sp. nov. GSS16]